MFQIQQEVYDQVIYIRKSLSGVLDSRAGQVF